MGKVKAKMKNFIDEELAIRRLLKPEVVREVEKEVLVVMGSAAEVECVVGARGTRILLGQIPLEAMDLIVDPKTWKLMPRPESPDMPLINILRGR